MPRYKLIPPVVLALPLLIGALITGLNYPLTWDEPAYYSVLMIFGDNYLPSIEELRSYNRFDATPLSAIIFGLWGKIFGFDPWKLRILSVFFSFGAILAFYMISKSLLFSLTGSFEVFKDGPLCLGQKVDMGLRASAAERGQFSRPHSGELLLSCYVPPERVVLG